MLSLCNKTTTHNVAVIHFAIVFMALFFGRKFFLLCFLKFSIPVYFGSRNFFSKTFLHFPKKKKRKKSNRLENYSVITKAISRCSWVLYRLTSAECIMCMYTNMPILKMRRTQVFEARRRSNSGCVLA